VDGRSEPEGLPIQGEVHPKGRNEVEDPEAQLPGCGTPRLA
jgi:hypothetical protein